MNVFDGAVAYRFTQVTMFITMFGITQKNFTICHSIFENLSTCLISQEFGGKKYYSFLKSKTKEEVCKIPINVWKTALPK